MNLVGTNDKAMNFFTGNSTLLSGQMIGFSIYMKNYQLIAELDIKLLYNKDKVLYKIRFIEVQEYSFYHNKDYSFSDISSYKFCKSNEMFYISLDPDEGISSISNKDNDFILSNHIEAYTI